VVYQLQQKSASILCKTFIYQQQTPITKSHRHTSLSNQRPRLQTNLHDRASIHMVHFQFSGNENMPHNISNQVHYTTLHYTNQGLLITCTAQVNSYSWPLCNILYTIDLVWEVISVANLLGHQL